jgi:hypothetical protein
LSEAQEKLRRLLAERDARARKPLGLANMFAGACHAMHNVENLDRLAQSAHSLRELLEKLPLSSGDEVVRQGRRASERQKVILDSYGNAKKRSPSYDRTTSTWNGAIDDHVRRVFVVIEEAAKERSSADEKRDRSLTFIRAQDPTGEPMPPDIEKDLVERWMQFDKLFQDVAHHRMTLSPAKYEEHVTNYIEYLLQLLRAETVATFDMLDQIIKAAEEGA